MSQELLDMSEEFGESFWKRHHHRRNIASFQWCRKGENLPLKAKTVPSDGKIIITVFWDCQGIVLIDYLDKDTTINS